MPPRSLYEMAKAVAIKNINSIDDVGLLNYDMIRTVLIKVENPEQLRLIEENCPQIKGYDAEIWRELIKRDVPNWESKADQLKDPSDWYTVYRKLVKENEELIAADANALKKTMDAIRVEREKHKSRLVENPRALPRVPMDPKLRQGTNLNRKRAIELRKAQAGPIQKNTKSIIEIARRQVQKEKRGAYLSTPTHLLSLKASKITSVPQSFLDQYRKPAVKDQKPMKEVGLKRKIDDISSDATEKDPVSPRSKVQLEREEKAKRREIALAQGKMRREREAADKLAARMW
ncbi:MAG: hypothetical protein M1839_005636 [Geoglossum umbratile]|nr:MAG: hypothetical protein M1839_005636 [Geoglossum umbratile]